MATDDIPTDHMRALMAEWNGVHLEPALLPPLRAVAAAMNGVVRATADAHLPFDSAPWSFETLKAQFRAAEPAAEAGEERA
ncbi:hypothetical protein [Aquabacter sediminis]|uniref:hypothetical protein n=1 Tax=Aquabacter sediminis TaxID=3029197 RepID=UPI00237E0F20|nr:hypothetical protein [Aquabacter sp. P-9]MDE1570567.1 hypothetical protein [Aquabacter sp. P-9]